MKTSAAALLALSLLTTPALAQRAQNAVTWGFTTEIETLDPYATGKGTVQLLTRNVLENLVVRDVKGVARPALATSWKWLNETTIEFTLRKGVKFHNGQPFDADDVVYSVTYVKKPESKISSQGDYGFISKAEKIDQFKVKLTLSAPTPSAIDRLTQTLYIVPHTAHAATPQAEWGRKPIGTGPYTVASFEAGRKAEFAKNPNYYKADWGAPRLDRITVLSLSDPQTRIAELTSGRVDFVWTLTPDHMQQLTANKNIATTTGTSTAVAFLSMDSAGRTGANPMQDKNVRMAIAHTINRPAIAQVFRGPGSRAIDAPCHPNQFGCTQDVLSYRRDIARARELMKASAYPNGFEVTISAFTENGPVAEAIIGDLNEIGIKGKLDFRETSAWVKDFFAGNLRLAVVPWPSSGVNDVSALVPFFFQGGQGDYARDAEVVEWFKKASTINDANERSRLYRLGFEKIAREALAVPLVTTVTNYAFRSGFDFTPPADGYPLMYMFGWKK